MMVTGMVLVPTVMLLAWWLDDSDDDDAESNDSDADSDDDGDRYGADADSDALGMMIRCFTLEWNDPGVCCQVRWIKGEALDYTGDDYYDDYYDYYYDHYYDDFYDDYYDDYNDHYYDDFYATADADDAAVELFFLASIAVL